ncbi:MAG: phosphoesterase [Oscillospiraceae bacterium]|nr:phosphoesterase [Oscillospiraceae bacterium]
MKRSFSADLRKFLRDNPHAWWALYLPIYLIGFFTVEHFVDGSGGYWVSWIPLDDKIPFLEGFVLAYYAWFPLLAGTGIYLLLRDGPAFRRYMQFIAIGFTLSTLICAFFPNGQDMRPVVFTHHNVFTFLVSMIYSADTNTNVFPSVHVVGCLAAIFAYFDSAQLKKLRIPAILLSLFITCSTVFIKQHSALDIFGAMALCLPIWVLMRIVRRKDLRHETKETIVSQKNSPAGAGDQET